MRTAHCRPDVLREPFFVDSAVPNTLSVFEGSGSEGASVHQVFATFSEKVTSPAMRFLMIDDMKEMDDKRREMSLRPGRPFLDEPGVVSRVEGLAFGELSLDIAPGRAGLPGVEGACLLGVAWGSPAASKCKWALATIDWLFDRDRLIALSNDAHLLERAVVAFLAGP